MEITGESLSGRNLSGGALHGWRFWLLCWLYPYFWEDARADRIPPGLERKQGETVSAPAGEAAKDTTETTSGNAAGGTGRFMEEEVSLPENFDAILDMEKLDRTGGSVWLASSGRKERQREAVWDSSDGGGSWEKQGSPHRSAERNR